MIGKRVIHLRKILSLLMPCYCLCLVFWPIRAIGQPGAGPMPVAVWPVVRADLEQSVHLPARAQAINQVEIRPRTTGVLLEKHIREGQWVEKGDLLFSLEPDILEATIRSMKASLEKADSDVKIALQTKKRVERLLKKKMVSEDEVDRAKAEYQMAVAQQSIAKAELERAELDLQFAKIYAPIAGRVGIIHVSEGDLVKEDESASLVSITQLDPIWVNFTLPSKAYVAWRQNGPKLDLSRIPIRLFFEETLPYSQTGKVVFVNHQVDPSTGNVMLRAQFPNANHDLMPGLFLRVNVQYTLPNVIAIPQHAVTYSDQGASVLVINSDSQVEPRPVELNAFSEEQWLVKSGLKEGDQVIISSLQKLMPGTPVTPLPTGEEE